MDRWKPVAVVAGGFVAVVALAVALGMLVDGPLAAPVLDGFDRPVVRAFRDARAPALTDVMRAATALGGHIVALVVLAVAALVAFALSRSVRWLAFFIVVAACGLQLATVVKPIVGRDRPLLDPVYTVSTDAFPSGHATVAAACWGAIAFFVARWFSSKRIAVAAWIVGLTMIGLVGITRVYLGVHWPSDVLAGWGLGGAWVAISAAATDPPARPR